MSGRECVEGLLAVSCSAGGLRELLATKPEEAEILRRFIAAENTISIRSWSRQQHKAHSVVCRTAQKFEFAGHEVMITRECEKWRHNFGC